jgi:hypothetical protein
MAAPLEEGADRVKTTLVPTWETTTALILLGTLTATMVKGVD